MSKRNADLTASAKNASDLDQAKMKIIEEFLAAKKNQTQEARELREKKLVTR